MNRLKPITIISTLFLSTVSVQSFAISNNQLNNQRNKATCEIIIDAGSSGSRLHLFKITPSTNTSNNLSNNLQNKTLPIAIEDLTEDDPIETKPGISSYVDNPDGAGVSIAGLLNNLKKNPITNKCDQPLKDIPVYLNATAGMRPVPEEQQKAIYSSIEKLSFNWMGKSPKTIPGWQEGLFDWLSLNYENIKNGEATSGALDLGGASTQLAFDIKNSPYSNLITTTNDDEKKYPLNLNNKEYNIFSISFLGLGQDQAREKILKTSPNSFYYCYPENAVFGDPRPTPEVAQRHPLPLGYYVTSQEKFRPMICRWAAKRVIDQKDIYNKVHKFLTPELTSKHNDKKFMAFSGFYYTSDFFDKAQNLKEIKSSIRKKCKGDYTTWDNFRINNPNTKPNFLFNECINGSYTLELLHYGYKFPINNSDKIKFTSDVDWTKGAALYYFLYPLKK